MQSRATAEDGVARDSLLPPGCQQPPAAAFRRRGLPAHAGASERLPRGGSTVRRRAAAIRGKACRLANPGRKGAAKDFFQRWLRRFYPEAGWRTSQTSKCGKISCKRRRKMMKKSVAN